MLLLCGKPVTKNHKTMTDYHTDFHVVNKEMWEYFSGNSFCTNSIHSQVLYVKNQVDLKIISFIQILDLLGIMKKNKNERERIKGSI